MTSNSREEGWLDGGPNRSNVADMARTAEKTAEKTASPSPTSGFALPVGARPGNTGGKPGRSGRKSRDFRRLCGIAVDKYARPKAVRVLREQDPELKPGVPNPVWWAAATYLGRYGHSEAHS